MHTDNSYYAVIMTAFRLTWVSLQDSLYEAGFLQSSLQASSLGPG